MNFHLCDMAPTWTCVCVIVSPEVLCGIVRLLCSAIRCTVIDPHGFHQAVSSVLAGSYGDCKHAGGALTIGHVFC